MHYVHTIFACMWQMPNAPLKQSQGGSLDAAPSLPEIPVGVLVDAAAFSLWRTVAPLRLWSPLWTSPAG